MSSTNKTTNYDLSQFIGSDKPAWLTDYNQDMAKIDAGIDTAQDTATAADGKADANTSSIGNLSYLSTTAKTDLVAAINEVDSNSETAQSTANSANESATSALTKANTAISGLASFENKFNFTQSGNLTFALTGATVVGTNNTLHYACNADGSIGKLYGRLVFTASGSTVTARATGSPFRPASTITIDGTILLQATDGILYPATFTIDTSGTIVATFNSGVGSGQTARANFVACTLFIHDFGD